MMQHSDLKADSKHIVWCKWQRPRTIVLHEYSMEAARCQAVQGTYSIVQSDCALKQNPVQIFRGFSNCLLRWYAEVRNILNWLFFAQWTADLPVVGVV